MPSIREKEADRYTGHHTRAELVDALVLTPSPFLQPRLDDEMFLSRLSNEATSRSFMTMVLKVLMQMNFDVISALALGTLPQEARGALNTHFANDKLNHGDKSPAVYAMFIVDENGMPPTKADVIEILSVMGEYIGEDSDDLVRKVDTQFSGKKRAWRYAYKDETQRAHAAFIEGMEKRLDIADDEGDTPEPASNATRSDDADAPKPPSNSDTPSQITETVYTQSGGEEDDDTMDQPIPCGISEVGFSITPYKRIADHERHMNSNDIMNLFEASAKHLFGNKYSVEGYVVARVVEPTLVGLSEAVISRLACSYTDLGGGFNARLAGLNVQGLNNLPTIQADARLRREAWIMHEANEDMVNVEDERVRVEERIAYFEARIAARHKRHNEATEQYINAAEEYIYQSERLANIRQQIKEQNEKIREFVREAEESHNPNWLQDLKEFCEGKK
ncbi:hypothetical protein V500_01519 [Pseudogymnoascus sp. VKM F-4518 (FW-2643)]|nr:hypothetical protein V500_01519 [Pseudogymnoascus sp. VKM F-4518 (FW-2643)]